MEWNTEVLSRCRGASSFSRFAFACGALTIVGVRLANDDKLIALIELAKQEDLGQGDLSTSLLAGAELPAQFRLITKEPCVLAGCEVAPLIVAAYDESIVIDWAHQGGDGLAVETPPFEWATLTGPLGSILTAERVLLNFLQRLCGIATLTRQFVDAIAGSQAKILDTRKTTPGWRLLEKYAVRCGGGFNHRMGLYDAVLIKDNHLEGIATSQLASFVQSMLQQLKEKCPEGAMAIAEADTLDEAKELLRVTDLDVILLDNFSRSDLKRAVEVRDAAGLRGKLELEASGGITLDTVGAVARTGVDRISVGALTHSARAIDLSLERC